MYRIWLVSVVMWAAVARVDAEQTGVSSETAGRLERLGKTYDAELSKINADAHKERQDVIERYVKSLAALDASAKKAGRLESLLAIRKEQERFAADKAVTESHISSDLVGLADSQTLSEKVYWTARLRRAAVRGLCMDGERTGLRPFFRRTCSILARGSAQPRPPKRVFRRS